MLLRADYSPEQIVGTLKKQDKQTVSIQRIYQHIWKDKKHNRDLEINLIIGKDHNQAILTINNRVSGML